MNLALGQVAQRGEDELADLAAAKLSAAIARHAEYRAQSEFLRPGEWRSAFAAWCEGSARAAPHNDKLAKIEARLAASPATAVRRRMAALFRLAPDELDLLDCALALYGEPALQDDLRGLFPRAALLDDSVVTGLFGRANRPIARATSPLLRWGLLEQGAAGLGIDPDMAALLCGKPGLDRVLAGCAVVVDPPAFAVPGWPVAETAEAAMRLTEMARSVRIIVRAAPGEGRQLFAAAVAAELSSRVLRVDPDLALDQAGLAMRAQRLALLTGHTLFWTGAVPLHPPGIARVPLQFVGIGVHDVCPAEEGASDIWVDLPALDTAARSQVWQALARADSPVAPSDCGRLGAAARLGDLIALAQHAPQDRAAACEVLGRRMRSRIVQTGNAMALPFARDDLVLSAATAAQFDTILQELSGREALLAASALDPHYARLGQAVMFHGPSGTGKTMAAQVLARELGCELVRIDCASIVSKFIGETAKLLRSTFDALRGSGAIALFDEADALFAKRTELKDSNDRHANADTNYLLQLIEDFDEIAILATNRKENIDSAFLRRLRYVVEFGELPAAGRATLWSRHLAAIGGKGIAPDWAARLALVDLSPAQIKGAALSAVFIGERAGSQGIQRFVTGIERELAKDSRALDAGLRRRLSDG